MPGSNFPEQASAPAGLTASEWATLHSLLSRAGQQFGSGFGSHLGSAAAGALVNSLAASAGHHQPAAPAEPSSAPPFVPAVPPPAPPFSPAAAPAGLSPAQPPAPPVPPCSSSCESSSLVSPLTHRIRVGLLRLGWAGAREKGGLCWEPSGEKSGAGGGTAGGTGGAGGCAGESPTQGGHSCKMPPKITKNMVSLGSISFVLVFSNATIVILWLAPENQGKWQLALCLIWERKCALFTHRFILSGCTVAQHPMPHAGSHWMCHQENLFSDTREHTHTHIHLLSSRLLNPWIFCTMLWLVTPHWNQHSFTWESREGQVCVMLIQLFPTLMSLPTIEEKFSSLFQLDQQLGMV